MSTEQMEGAWCQIFARVAEQTRRLNTKTYHCEWCATSITPSDDSFWCQNDDCHKVVCGRKGCSSNLAYFACCEECEDEDNEEDYLWEHKMKMTDVLDDVLHQEIDVAEYDDNCKFKRWITISLKEIDYNKRFYGALEAEARASIMN